MNMLRRLLAAILPDRVKTVLLNLVELFKEQTFRPYVIKKSVEGVTFNFLVSDLTAKRWYDNEAEWPEMKFLMERLVRPRDIIFECGGHHGCTALFLALCVGEGGKVVTFEPSRKNASVIEANVRLNGLNNVAVEQKAVGSRAGTAVVIDASNTVVAQSHRAGSARPGDCEGGLPRRRMEVETVSLDGYARGHNLYPTLLKIDVEGYEVEVLKGAGDLLGRTPKLAIEIHSPADLARYGTSVAEILSLLDLERYHCWIQWDHFEMPVVFDGSQTITKHVHLYAIPRAGA